MKGRSLFTVSLLLILIGLVAALAAGQGIGDEQRFIGARDVAHGGCFGQQFLIDVQPTGGVQHDDIEAALPRFRHGAPGDLDRRLAGNDR